MSIKPTTQLQRAFAGVDDDQAAVIITRFEHFLTLAKTKPFTHDYYVALFDAYAALVIWPFYMIWLEPKTRFAKQRAFARRTNEAVAKSVFDNWYQSQYGRIATYVNYDQITAIHKWFTKK